MMEGNKDTREEDIPDERGYVCEQNEELYFPSKISFASH